MPTPIIAWFDSAHTAQVTTPFDFQVVDAGTWGNEFTFNIWNNKGGTTDASKMEECTITTRTMSGGSDGTAPDAVELVTESWFHAQVDSLGETNLNSASSKIGAIGTRPLGTTGTTKHLKSLSASTWTASTVYTVGTFVKPATGNGFIYECTTGGTSGATAPTWTATEGATVNDSTVVWKAVKIDHTPLAQEILGVQNDGSAVNSAGNFVTVTLAPEVPLDAGAGRQDFKLRCSYRYV